MSAVRFAVGACTISAWPAKATSPIATPRGCASMNALAAACAAPRRVGATSVAAMLSDTSIASTTVPRSAGAVSHGGGTRRGHEARPCPAAEDPLRQGACTGVSRRVVAGRAGVLVYRRLSCI